MRKLRLAAAPLVLGLAVLLLPGAAAARTILVGGDLTGPTTLNVEFSGPTATLANAAVVGPDPAAAPVDGRIVRWRIGPQPGTDAYRLVVLHPTGLGSYIRTATGDPESASSLYAKTFQTSLPIEAGDLIGLNIEAGGAQVKFAAVQAAAATVIGWDPVLPVGTPLAPAASLAQEEAQYNADLAPTPAVRRLTPAAGPLAGGSSVLITGRDFTEVSGVAFGAVPASSFAVLSESEILATAPAGVRPGPFDVRVTNAIGTSSDGPADVFTYEPAPPVPTPAPTPAPSPEPAPTCKVPSLSGKTLPATRRLLRRSRCRLGAVRGHRRSGDKVIKQSPRPGLTRPAGWAVNVTID